MLLSGQAGLMPPWLVLTALSLVLGASLWVFWALVRRWTIQRRWAALAEWAEAHNYRAELQPARTPAPLDALTTPPPRTLMLICDAQTALVQIHTPTTPASSSPNRSSRWHLLVRRIPAAWPVTALRPVSRPTSIIDFFALASYPSLIPPERFVLFGADSAAARRLADSALRALLAPDIGLLLLERHLVLDFSSRPFDDLELQRMTSLAEQLAANLPSA